MNLKTWTTEKYKLITYYKSNTGVQKIQNKGLLRMSEINFFPDIVRVLSHYEATLPSQC